VTLTCPPLTPPPDLPTKPKDYKVTCGNSKETPNNGFGSEGDKSIGKAVVDYGDTRVGYSATKVGYNATKVGHDATTLGYGYGYGTPTRSCCTTATAASLLIPAPPPQERVDRCAAKEPSTNGFGPEGDESTGTVEAGYSCHKAEPPRNGTAANKDAFTSGPGPKGDESSGKAKVDPIDTTGSYSDTKVG
jgi:hypothetical protein